MILLRFPIPFCWRIVIIWSIYSVVIYNNYCFWESQHTKISPNFVFDVVLVWHFIYKDQIASCWSSFKEEKRVVKDVDMDLITNFRQRDWMVTWGHQQFTICTCQKFQDAPLIILTSRYTKFIRFLKIQYSNA